MLEIIVRLEQRIPSEEFDKNATNTPNITGETPSQIEDDLRCSVMSCRDHGGVIFVVKSSRAKINESYLWIKQHFTIFGVAGVGTRG